MLPAVSEASTNNPTFTLAFNTDQMAQ